MALFKFSITLQKQHASENGLWISLDAPF